MQMHNKSKFHILHIMVWLTIHFVLAKTNFRVCRRHFCSLCISLERLYFILVEQDFFNVQTKLSRKKSILLFLMGVYSIGILRDFNSFNEFRGI